MAVKKLLISLLEDNKGRFVSGEEIAEKLNCSRTAVWKAINQLKDEGYDIDSIRNKGYKLSEKSDMLSEEAIQRYLNYSYPVKVFQEITSTNDVLKKMAVAEHSVHGTTIISDYQTGGKGRLGRTFFSPKKSGLYISMLLRPQGTVIDNLMLTAQSAVAVYRAVKRVTGIKLSIKWVNDLYYDGRKVCGILSEGQASMESGRMDYIVVGIGVNIYEPENGFPEDIKNKAGSLLGRQSDAVAIDRNKLAAEIIKEFYSIAEEKKLAPEYIERNLVPGHDIIVIDGLKVRNAHAVGIRNDGTLDIVEDNGTPGNLVFGEVSVRLNDNKVII
ncbi:biotin--[acetyl-CoA-carboxylase] ligase [Oribacterium sp. WCC10]|uniref:biotin--[acetyl-CoA-carboxylase] ligase n=1 Tax=Oribacterium sp. WCC10 TaxID=1855343 RepID=UPI0008E5C31A|nr:biotin--[acetyl-CoA-carboxylase] ligase [Oribacterium sp. WCC10]SFG12451.1 BirA family transcriptional regulator, biotin operon repressor / biotin-[acetyl-CoA-carboxylase] ligase [Oribacterium sp. WCC10]